MGNIRKNYFLQLSFQILNMALPFVTSPYISRILGAHNLGIYSYTYSIASLFVLFINLGIEKYGTRLIAINRNNKDALEEKFSELLVLKCLIGLIVCAIYIALILLFFEYKIYFLIQGFLLVATVVDINWFFFGIEQFKVTVTRNFIFKIVTVALVFLLVKSENDLKQYCLIMSFGTAISQSIVWCVLGKYINIKKIIIKDALVHVKPLVVLFVAILAQSAYTYIDKIMLGSLSTMDQLGFCENAYKVVAFPMGVITSFGTVMLPRMSVLFIDDSVLAKKYLQNSLYVITVLAIGMSAGMFAIGEEFSILFWGSMFAISGKIIKIIAPIVVFMAIADVLRNQLLIAKKRDGDYTIAVVIGAIVNVICNFIFIPRFGAYGAAFGSVVSYLAILLYQVFVTRKEVKYLRFLLSMLPFVFFAVCMVVVEQLLSLSIQGTSTWFLLMIKILIGALLYCALSFVWMFFTKASLLKLFKKR